MHKKRITTGFVYGTMCILLIAVVPVLTTDMLSLAPLDDVRMEIKDDGFLVPVPDEIPARMDADLVYDSESDRMIFFGGATDNLQNDYNDTWSYDYNINTWTQMDPAVAPPATDWHQMAYDSGEDRVVLFGGHISGHAGDWQNHNQTWVYDYNSDTWAEMNPDSAPEALCGQAMEYDSESGLVVLFGGSPSDWYLNSRLSSETWTYDLSTDTWTNVTTGIHPSPRLWPVMTYDSESDLIVLFGGWDLSGDWTILTDTWTYDANTNTWTEIDTAGPDSLGDVVYDSESDRVVFFGGALSLSELVEDLCSETWSYDTNTETWEMMVPNVDPPVRSRVQMTYDSESDVVLLFGGVIDGGWVTEEVLDDCWAYDLNNDLWNNVNWDWQEQTPLDSPDARNGCPIVYDIESDRMVIFSGWSSLPSDDLRFNDTWSYDYNSNTWTNMSPAVMPAGRGGHAMAYNQEDDIIVMFGGSTGSQSDDEKYMADTWTYDLNLNTWTNMSPASNPTPRLGSAMAYDVGSDVFVMFGGYLQDHTPTYETWIYNYTSNAWTNATSDVEENPEARIFGAMAYDYENEYIVLGGGGNWGGYVNDIWRFVGANESNDWQEIIPTNDRPEFGYTITYDSESELVIAYGGPRDAAMTDLVSETWVFNDTSGMDFNGEWNNTYSPNNPPERSMQYLAYDIESDRTIMFGGVLPGVGQVLGDTWAYNYMVNPLSNPNRPENFAVSTGADGLVLTWNAPIPIVGVEVLGYNIYRGDESGVYTKIAGLGNVLTYTDKTAGFDMTYYYAATAFSEGGESVFSDEDTGSRISDYQNDSIYTFIVYGDTRSTDDSGVSPIHDDLVSLYLQHDPEMVLHSGDMVIHGGLPEQWLVFDESISAIWDYDPNIEFFASPGNHELYTDVYGVNDDDLSTYQDYFDFSDVIDQPGETELYYSFDRYGIHFISLNTVFDWDGNGYSCPEAQMTWLEADLAGDYETIIVITHYPSYSILKDRPDRLLDAESIRDTFHDLFVEYGVDIVFTGHNHYYHRAPRDGIQYITSAGGGAPLYEISTVDTDWEAGDVGFSEYHYCVCSIDPETNMLVVKTVLMDGTVADTLEITVPDITDPVIDSPTDIQYDVGSTGHSIMWHPSDLFPDSFELYKDTVLLDSGDWNGSSITVNVDGLAIGTYNYTLVVFDTSGNMADDTVFVTVLPVPSPYPVELMLIAVGVGVLAIIVIVVVLRRRT